MGEKELIKNSQDMPVSERWDGNYELLRLVATSRWAEILPSKAKTVSFCCSIDRYWVIKTAESKWLINRQAGVQFQDYTYSVEDCYSWLVFLAKKNSQHQKVNVFMFYFWQAYNLFIGQFFIIVVKPHSCADYYYRCSVVSMCACLSVCVCC